ncbi:MAG: four helix bundle protein [Candidatus Absconditabacterales bacterium]
MKSKYQDLFVWQKAILLTEKIYEITKQYPKDETYGLVSQMRKSAVSIPSNIAEGSLRNTDKEFGSFLYNARGSAA